MRKQSSHLRLVLMAFALSIACLASFPAQALSLRKVKTNIALHTGAISRLLGTHRIENAFTHHIRSKPYHFKAGPKTRRYNGGGGRYADNDSPWFGIVAFAAGVIGALTTTILLTTGATPFLMAASITLACIAIGCGVHGLQRQMRGFAAAGMVLGILELVAIVAAVVAVLSYFGSL